MLKFRCMYCGQKILASDNKMGTKAHCPKCNHVIFINEASLIKEGEKEISDAEINFLLNRSKSKNDILKEPYEYTEKQKSFLKKWLAPDFDELSMFLMVAAAVLVAAANNGIGGNIIKFAQAVFSFEPDPKVPITIGVITFILFGGAALPVVHVFSKREKDEWEKVVMLVFAVIFTAGSGIFAGQAMLKEAGQGFDLSFNSKPWLLQLVLLTGILKWKAVFPLWNIANGILMLLLLRAGIINTECIADRDAKLWEVFLGLIILCVVFVICQYGFKMHWAVTYSICIVYSTNFVRWGKG